MKNETLLFCDSVIFRPSLPVNFSFSFALYFSLPFSMLLSVVALLPPLFLFLFGALTLSLPRSLSLLFLELSQPLIWLWFPWAGVEFGV